MNMIELGLSKPKVVMYAIVRDKNGRPKVDDPSTLHPEQIKMLTPQECADLGIEPIPTGDTL
jgi:hypothetical protein